MSMMLMLEVSSFVAETLLVPLSPNRASHTSTQIVTSTNPSHHIKKPNSGEWDWETVKVDARQGGVIRISSLLLYAAMLILISSSSPPNTLSVHSVPDLLLH